MEENRKIEERIIIADTAAADGSDFDDRQNGEKLPSFEGADRAISADDDGDTVEESVANDASLDKHGEREEYEELIKNRFKELYAEDMQKLINRRFRKYKVLEERYRILEETLIEKESALRESATKLLAAEMERLNAVDEAVKETEKRVVEEIRAKRLRPSENGTAPRRSTVPFDVSKLTKNERAGLAKRAAGGEKIKL